MSGTSPNRFLTRLPFTIIAFQKMVISRTAGWRRGPYPCRGEGWDHTPTDDSQTLPLQGGWDHAPTDDSQTLPLHGGGWDHAPTDDDQTLPLHGGEVGPRSD